MSRDMKGTEVDRFEKTHGYEPTALQTSLAALAVFVNEDDPVQCLTMQQIDAGFSRSWRLGGKEDVRTWSQLGLTGERASRAWERLAPSAATCGKGRRPRGAPGWDGRARGVDRRCRAREEGVDIP